MRGPIEARIASLRGQVRRLLALHGLGWLAFGLTAAVLFAGSADWLVHLAPEVRMALLVGVVLLGAWLALVRVVLPLVVRFADLDIALRIEDRWPGLNDRLASTVQFLRHVETADDSSAGSKALRVATVEQTMAEVETIDFRQAVDPRPARKALAWAAVALAAVGGIAFAEPQLSGIAFRRLINPYGPDRWPRATHLTVLDETPKKVARGMPFALAVAVAPGERLPSTAKVTFTYPDGETATEPLRPTDDGTFRGRVETVAQPFTFTVEAGDDVTDPWSVAVVPPPALEKVDVRVVAPEYTALAPLTLAPGNTQVRAVEGGRIEVAATANKPIASAVLRRGESVATEAVTISADGRALATAFEVKDARPFWVELKDTEGFSSQEVMRFDVRMVKDEPPRVVVEDPTKDREVPVGATVPLRFAVDDDFGIKLIRLVYKVALGHSEPTGEQIINLWAAPEPHGDGGPVKHRVVSYRWDLASIPDLQPGSIITFYAEARDFDNLKGPNIGKSRELRLRVVSKEEAERLIDEQQRAIHEEIDRVLAIQKQAEAPVKDARRTLDKVPQLPKPLQDQLKAAESIQRQVTNRVTNKADGLEEKIRQARQDLNDFQLQDRDADRQLTGLQEAVERIKGRNLNPAEQSLAKANKAIDPANAGPDDKPNNPEAQPQDQAQQPPNPEGQQPDGQPQGDQAKDQDGQQAKGQQSKNQGGQQPKNQAGQPKGQSGQQPEGNPNPDQPQGDQPQGDQPKGDQAKAQSGQQPKNQAGSQPKGQQPKGQQPKGQSGQQPKGDQGQPQDQGGEQPKGDQGQPQGDQPKGQSGQQPQGQQAKGQQSKGQQAKGQQSKNQSGQAQAPRPQDNPPAPKVALAEAEKNQKAIVDELETMKNGMSRFDQLKDAVKDAKSMLRQQEELKKEAGDVAARPEMMGKPKDALTPEEQAELANLAAKQNELGKQLQALQEKLEGMAKAVEPTDPLGARALRDAAEQTRKAATAAKMGEAAEQLDKNQMAQAQAGQEQAAGDLKKMIAEMEDRRGKELSRLVAELKAAEAEMKKLRDQQTQNLKKTQQARAETDPQKRNDELKRLAKEQKRIEDDLKKQLQKLAKMNNPAGARAGQKAAEEMAKAQGQLDQDQGEEAEQEEKDALQDLKQAQQEVAEARRDAEEQLAMEQIAKMKDGLVSIGERQDKMVKETTRYEETRKQNDGKLSLGQRAGVKELGRAQAGLKDEAAELIDRLGEGAPVFALTLKKAADGMETASQRLKDLKTDEATINAQKLAAGRFQQLIDSLKPDKGKGGAGANQPPGGDQPPGGNGQQQNRGGDGIPAAAQLKMLRSLQKELNERTDFFDELLRRHKELNPEQAAELDKLHEDQGTLADLVRDLTQPKKDDGED